MYAIQINSNLDGNPNVLLDINFSKIVCLPVLLLDKYIGFCSARNVPSYSI